MYSKSTIYLYVFQALEIKVYDVNSKALYTKDLWVSNGVSNAKVSTLSQQK